MVDDGQRMEAGLKGISSPCEPNGSGELKKGEFFVVVILQP